MEKVPGQQAWLGLVLSNFSLVYQERGQYDVALPLLERAVTAARPGSEKGSEGLAWALTKGAESGAFPGASVSAVDAIGQSLFTDYAFPFEVTSVLILVAMVGAVVLARRGEHR